MNEFNKLHKKLKLILKSFILKILIFIALMLIPILIKNIYDKKTSIIKYFKNIKLSSFLT